MSRLLRVALAAVSFAYATAAAAALKVVDTGPVPHQGVQQMVVHSDRLDRDFLIEVTSPQLPELPGQKMPAIYALDLGDDVAGPMGRQLTRSAAMRPAYIVAVGYLPGHELARNADLVHPRFAIDGQAVGGGGAAFEAVLLDEIKPLLEARFPLDPKRSYLFGHSFGGLFAAEVLADRPDAFAGYIIGSASAWFDPTLPSRLTAAARRGPAARRVYVAWGGAEDPRVVQAGAAIARALGAPGSKLFLRSVAYPRENHTSYYTRLILDAFPWLLPKPPEHHAIAFDPALGPRYEGTYRLVDGRTAKIWTKDGFLMGQLTGMPAIPLFPESRTDFFVKGFDAGVSFDAGAGHAPGLTLHAGGVDTHAVRVP
jgi:predicted alpha/beta superfamily hydrolase